MPSSDAVLRFAAEFFTFLVAVTGAAVVVIRPGLLGIRIRSRLSLGFGFLAVAAAAFLHGSLLYDGDDLPVIAVRLAGIVLLAVGTLGWRTDSATPRIVWASLVLMTVGSRDRKPGANQRSLLAATSHAVPCRRTRSARSRHWSLSPIFAFEPMTARPSSRSAAGPVASSMPTAPPIETPA